MTASGAGMLPIVPPDPDALSGVGGRTLTDSRSGVADGRPAPNDPRPAAAPARPARRAPRSRRPRCRDARPPCAAARATGRVRRSASGVAVRLSVSMPSASNTDGSRASAASAYPSADGWNLSSLNRSSRLANNGPSRSPSDTVRPPASTTAIVCAARDCATSAAPASAAAGRSAGSCRDRGRCRR